MNFGNNTNIGCGVLAGIFVGTLAIGYIVTVIVTWLICLLLSDYGVMFDIRVATAIWLAMVLMNGMLNNGVKIKLDK